MNTAYSITGQGKMLYSYENFTINNTYAHNILEEGIYPSHLEVCRLSIQKKLSVTLNIIVPHISSHLYFPLSRNNALKWTKNTTFKLNQMEKSSPYVCPQ